MNVTLQARADTRYRFSEWRGVACSSQTTCTFKVNGDVPIIARFDGGVEVFIRSILRLGQLSIATDASGNYVVAGGMGSTTDFGDGSVDPATVGSTYIVKYRPNHTVFWKRFLPGNAAIQDVAFTTDGGVIAVGGFTGTVDFGPGAPLSSDDPDFQDIFIVHYSPSGDDRWVKTFTTGSSTHAIGVDIAISANGTFALFGDFGQALSFSQTINIVSSPDPRWKFVAGFSALGEPIWATTLPRGFGAEILDPIAINAVGEVAVGWAFGGGLTFAGRNFTSSASDPIALVYSPTGAPLWAFHHAETGESSTARVAFDPFGRLLVAFAFDTPLMLGTDPVITPNGEDVVVAQFDSERVYERAFLFSGASWQAIDDLRVSAEGDIFVRTVGVESYDGWTFRPDVLHTIKLRSDGSYAWAAPLSTPFVGPMATGGGGTLWYATFDPFSDDGWHQLSE